MNHHGQAGFDTSLNSKEGNHFSTVNDAENKLDAMNSIISI